MSQHETLNEKSKDFGRNNFVRVERTRLTDDHGKPNGEFVLIHRGFRSPEGEETWGRFVSIPNDPVIRQWLARAILEA